MRAANRLDSYTRRLACACIEFGKQEEESDYGMA